MSAKISDILGVKGNIDKKASQFLSAAMEENGSSGFDYLKFKQSIDAMLKLELDEETAFKSAFITAKTMGVTKAGLVKSAKQYLDILMKEKSKFDEALQKRVEEHVASKSKEVDDLKHQIENMRTKIAEMEARIGEFEQKIASADQDVEKERKKIEETQQKFEGTFNSFVTIIQGDLDNIAEYI